MSCVLLLVGGWSNNDENFSGFRMYTVGLLLCCHGTLLLSSPSGSRDGATNTETGAVFDVADVLGGGFILLFVLVCFELELATDVGDLLVVDLSRPLS